MKALVFRLGIAICLGVSGYIHAELYINGYKAIPVVGPSFLWLGAASMVVALLVAVGAPLGMQVIAGALAAGTFGGFVLSRTVGIFGFTERGFDPAPEALISVVTEVIVMILVAVIVIPILLRNVPLLRRVRRAET